MQAADKPHRAIAAIVSSLGAPEWWSQMVTVGYERIRGLREKGQRRDGGYEASKSRTYNVPIATLFDAFLSARKRSRWLPVRVAVRSSALHKRMRIEWDDKTVVQVAFLNKGKSKSTVAVQHQKLRDKPAATAMKTVWAEHFDKLGQMLDGKYGSGTGCRVQGAGCVLGAGCGVLSAGFRVRGSFSVLSAGFWVQGSGCGVRSVLSAGF